MAFSSTFDKNLNTKVGGAISNREDLTEVLSILAPEETPVLSSLSKQKANSTFVEWTVDTLDAPVTTGIVEGTDIGETGGGDYANKFAARARLGNYIQKFRRAFRVSDLQEAVDSVGPAKFAQAEAKAIRELKRDIEKTILSSNVKQAQGAGQGGAPDTGSPYLLGGLGAWVNSSPDNGMGIPSGYYTPASSIDASAENLTESELNGLITSIYRENGDVNSLVLVADTGLRRTISDFARINSEQSTSIRNVNYVGGSADIKLSVELYQSDHGIVSIINMNPSTADATQTGAGYAAGFLLNTDYAGIHELIPMGSSRLPNLGGGERGFVDCALTLGVYHPKAHGKLTHTPA